jgi:hypothetical protein
MENNWPAGQNSQRNVAPAENYKNRRKIADLEKIHRQTDSHYVYEI